MPTYSFRVNGRRVSVESWDPNQPLLYVLRNQLGLHGAKYGCGLGQCGACTVLVDGQPAFSCLTPVQEVAGRGVTTIEGLGTPEKPDRLAAADAAPDPRAGDRRAGSEFVPLRHAHPHHRGRLARGKNLELMNS